MNTKYIVQFIAFFSLLIAFTLGEYYLYPPSVYNAKGENLENKIQNTAGTSPISNKNNDKENISEKKVQIFSDVFDESDLEKSGFKEVEFEKPLKINHLFNLIPFYEERDKVQIFKQEFFQKNEIQEKKRVFVVYSIFSTENKSILKVYTDIKNNITDYFEQDVEKQLYEDNKYGDKSFFIRLEENQKTMYLIVAYRDRLLGFEYPLGNTFSRHEEMEKFLLQIFLPSL